jgi:predicted ferric reductase
MIIIYGILIALTLAPLGASWLSVDVYRPSLVELGSTFGIIGFSTMLIAFLISGRTRWISNWVHIDQSMRAHRVLGISALGAAFLHPFFFSGSLSGGDRPWDPTRALTITTDFGAMASGIAALLLLPSFVLLARWHSALEYRYETWRWIHAIGGCCLIGLVLHHTLTAGRYSARESVALLWIVGSLIAFLSIIDSRLIRGWIKSRNPWTATEIQQVTPKQWSITVSPRSNKPLHYKAGQFAWLTIGSSPYSMEEHPFSISSAPTSGPNLTFLIKELGDFTNHLNQIEVGTRAYVNGPYGHLTVDQRTEPGIVLIAGGVGIAPMLGIIRELKLTNDPRQMHLIYGNRNASQIAFKEELDSLNPTYVIAEPSRGWDGHIGIIDQALLQKDLSHEQLNDWLFALCGPPAMLETVERYLAGNGVPQSRILSERFNFG